MEKKRLSFKDTILVAGTLFGMFFGAGNLIFPVHLGQLAGKNIIPAIIGFVITAVGIPILGVAAIGVTHSDGLGELSGKVGKRYSYFFTCILYLTIGPFFAIPRCATTSFTTGIAPLLGEKINERYALLIFSFIFFALVLLFSLKPGKITVWIGGIINPLFLIFLAILVVAAFTGHSVDLSTLAPDGTYESGSFFSSFIEGYNTMDAIAGLAFGIIVVNIIRRKGVENDSAVARDVLKSGVFSGLLMALIYVLTVIMGARSLGFTSLSENGGIAIAEIAKHYLGSFGSIVLAATITLACLKTSIGLVTSCSETFVKMFPRAFSYKVWAIIFTLFSFVISNVGLSAIIGYSVPVLMFIYPLAITLIILAFVGGFFNHDRAIYISVTALTLVAAIFDLINALPKNIISTLRLEAIIGLAEKYLPFYSIGLGWIIPAVVGFVIGLIIHFCQPKVSRV